jgi:hypothetical protein
MRRARYEPGLIIYFDNCQYCGKEIKVSKPDTSTRHGLAMALAGQVTMHERKCLKSRSKAVEGS